MKDLPEAMMLLEAWQKLVEYIPQKDRIEAARAYAILIDELHLDQQSLEEIKDGDHYLEAAINDYYGDDGDDEESYGDHDENEDY